MAVAAVQLDMVKTLCNIYQVDFKETENEALVTSITGSGLSRLGANALIKLIPGFGSVFGGLSMSIVSVLQPMPGSLSAILSMEAPS